MVMLGLVLLVLLVLSLLSPPWLLLSLKEFFSGWVVFWEPLFLLGKEEWFIHSVWAPACQDTIPGGHAGVGVVSLGGAPLTLPSFVTAEFKEFFRLGRVLRTTLPTGK